MIEGDGVTTSTSRSGSRSRSRTATMIRRLRRHVATGGRQRQLPDRGHALGLSVRAARAAASGRPDQRGHGGGARAPRPGAVARRRAPAGGRRRGQRRDEPAARRHDPRGARAGGRPAGRRPGNDEQRDHRRRRLDVLRDDRRRPGSIELGAGAFRRARRDEQHAQHAGRGAGARVPVAGRALRAPVRLGRRRAAPRRRRDRPADPRARAGDALRSSPTGGGTARPGRRAACPAPAGRTCSTASCCRRSAPARSSPVRWWRS